MARAFTNLDDLRERVAARLSDHRVGPGEGEVGKLSIGLARRASRTFRAHWTGFKITYPGRLLVLHCKLHDSAFWTEGFVSNEQPSWVLAFRDRPHPTRGSGGPRPEDDVAPPQPVATDAEHKRRLLEAGVITTEELIRMEDFDDPGEAVDAFFYYTSFYILKAVGADWSKIGFVADQSVGWAPGQAHTAARPIDEAIDQGLKRSDILWLTPDTAPGKPIPCWYVYTREKRLFTISGERQQVIPGAEQLRDAHIITRWKGRDVLMSEFDASVRVITPRDEEFDDIAEQLVNKRQSVRESAEETLERWRRDCVILELTPRG